jgi:hypothetical protein
MEVPLLVIVEFMNQIPGKAMWTNLKLLQTVREFGKQADRKQYSPNGSFHMYK